ncbi:hypothetical protein ACFV23_36920, partial [Streptomyces sp. NPDC059627]
THINTPTLVRCASFVPAPAGRPPRPPPAPRPHRDFAREPEPPTRARRGLGCAWMVFGGIFLLPAVFNTAAAVRELLG